MALKLGPGVSETKPRAREAGALSQAGLETERSSVLFYFKQNEIKFK